VKTRNERQALRNGFGWNEASERERPSVEVHGERTKRTETTADRVLKELARIGFSARGTSSRLTARPSVRPIWMTTRPPLFSLSRSSSAHVEMPMARRRLSRPQSPAEPAAAGQLDAALVAVKAPGSRHSERRRLSRPPNAFAQPRGYTPPQLRAFFETLIRYRGPIGPKSPVPLETQASFVHARAGARRLVEPVICGNSLAQ
jgi:hypothetical protein